MVVLVTLTMASWGWPMAGRGTSSTATLPTPFQTRAFMASSLWGVGWAGSNFLAWGVGSGMPRVYLPCV